MLSSISMPQSGIVPGGFATAFTALADVTSALPLEIEGVARIGGGYVDDDLPAQMAPLLALDGSPRPKDMHGIGGLAALNDVLDTQSADLMGRVGRGDLERLGIDTVDSDLLFGDGTFREMLSDLRGTRKLVELGNSYFAIAMENGERHADDDLMAKLLFVSAALTASRSKIDMDGLTIFEQAIDLASIVKMPGEPADPLNRDVRALLYENMAWAIDVDANPDLSEIYISRRLRAAKSWNHWLGSVNYPERRLSDATAMLVRDRVLNGAQLKPDYQLGHLFTRFVPNGSLEEAVRNLIRSAWLAMMDDETMNLKSDMWDAVCVPLTGAVYLLEGDLKGFGHGSYLPERFDRNDFKRAFKDIDKLAASKVAGGLAFKAAMAASVARSKEEGERKRKRKRKRD